MDGKPVAAPVKEPKVEPKPETKCFYCKGNGHMIAELPQIHGRYDSWKLQQSIYVLLMCTSLVLLVAPGYWIPVQLLLLVT